ncbi:MAG: hypothetical protein V1487_01395 [bacterium]
MEVDMNINGYNFSGPFSINATFTSDFAGVYLISNPQGKIIDVGETESMNTRLPNHDRKPCWVQNGGNALYVCNISQEGSRLALESSIRVANNPTCGIR